MSSETMKEPFSFSGPSGVTSVNEAKLLALQMDLREAAGMDFKNFNAEDVRMGFWFF